MNTNYFIHYLILIHCAHEKIRGRRVDLLVRKLKREDII